MLVLDADERLWPSNFATLKDLYVGAQDQFSAFEVGFKHITPDKNLKGGGMRVRLFKTRRGFYFSHNFFKTGASERSAEYLLTKGNFLVEGYDDECEEGFTWCQDISAFLTITHFQPGLVGRSQKLIDFYNAGPEIKDLSPASLPGFAKWKKFNPRRLQFGPLLKLGETPPIQ